MLNMKEETKIISGISMMIVSSVMSFEEIGIWLSGNKW